MNKESQKVKTVLVCSKHDAGSTEKEEYKNINLSFHLVDFLYVLNCDSIVMFNMNTE
jgi:hypothetical protein